MARTRVNREQLREYRRFLLATAGSIIITIDLGFGLSRHFGLNLDYLYVPLIALATLTILSSIIRKQFKLHKKVRKADYLLGVMSLLLSSYYVAGIFDYALYHLPDEVYMGYFFIFFIIEYSRVGLPISGLFSRPPVLFALSFLFIILVGTLLLKLPRSTVHGISFTDALFTSTSAVCVTGLIVLDTAKEFTHFGQAVILVLIQVGGLGVMTFTSFFAFFFKGQNTIEEQLTIRELTNSSLFDARKFVIQVVLTTLAIELIGAALIFYSVGDVHFASLSERVWFSIFHSISAFCNAGFSTLSDGLHTVGFRYNYSLMWIIMILIILGGIGFYIIFNSYLYFSSKIKAIYYRIFYRRRIGHSPWIINLNGRLVIATTAMLLLVGALTYLLFEDHHSLADYHTWYGKLTVAMFGSVTPRTAGFNVVDMSSLSTPTITICILLMWIGASPGSTGGGIKTTTFAVAVLNVLALVRGKERVEFGGREVGQGSVLRSFGIIFLSVFFLGFIITLVLNLEPGKRLLPIVFEVFSAMGTVGLSLGITPHLHMASKWIIAFTMFVGRVGLLMILLTLSRQLQQPRYRYPTEEIAN